MRRTVTTLIPAALSSLILAACGGGSTKSSTSATATAAAGSSEGRSPVVQTASNATLGTTVLTNARGLTLYRLSGERSGALICSSAACLRIWHPLSVSSGAARPAGAVAGLGVINRPDGTRQLTIRGMPLYTFAADRLPGDVKGQGLKDVGTWNAVTMASPGTSGASQAGPSAGATQTTPPAESTPAPHYGY